MTQGHVRRDEHMGERSTSRARPAGRVGGRPSGRGRQTGRAEGKRPRSDGERQRRARHADSRPTGRHAANRHTDSRPGDWQKGRQKKKQRKKWGIGKRLFVSLVILAVFGGLGYSTVVFFELKQISVANNVYTSAEEITGWIGQGRLSGNTLYAWWKYNHGDFSTLPAVESVHAKIKSPREVVVEVTEKTFIGRVDINGEFFYFDKDGIASYKSGNPIDGVPLIDGMEVDAEEVQMGKALPVSDKSVFEMIKEGSKLLEQNDLKPDKLEIVGKELTLWFGGVKILLGDGRHAPRMEQIPPILEKLNELYPGQDGVLHLENYEQGTEFIRFEPERD